jgi:hypothetical protein
VRYNPALLAASGLGSASVVAEELAVRPSGTMRAPHRAEQNRCMDMDSYSHSHFLRLKSRRGPKRATLEVAAPCLPMSITCSATALSFRTWVVSSGSRARRLYGRCGASIHFRRR